MKRYATVLLYTFSFILITTSAVAAIPKPKPTIVAKAGNILIFNEDVKAALSTMFQKQGHKINAPLTSFSKAFQESLIRGIIAKKLMVKEAEKQGIDDDPIIAASLQAHRETILQKSLLYFTAHSLVNDTAIKDRYQQMQTQHKNLNERHVSHLIIANKEDAKLAYQSLRKGATKNAVRKQLGTKATSEDFGFVLQKNLPNAIAEEAFSVKIGKFSKPIKSVFGHHILFVHASRNYQLPPLTDLHEELQEALYAEAIEHYMVDLLNHTEITLHLDNLQ